MCFRPVSQDLVSWGAVVLAELFPPTEGPLGVVEARPYFHDVRYSSPAHGLLGEILEASERRERIFMIRRFAQAYTGFSDSAMITDQRRGMEKSRK